MIRFVVNFDAVASRRVILALALSGCGPTTAVDAASAGESTTDASASGDGTAPTTTTTSASSPSDPTTPLDTGEAEVGPGSDDGTTESSTTGGTFLVVPDGGVCSCECDPWSQDCPRGDKCVPWANDGGDAWNAVRCSPLDRRPAAVGAPCVMEDSRVSGRDDCGAGAMCWGVDPDTLEGTCVAMCTGSEAEPTCEDGLGCVIGFEGTVIVCLPPCDPLTPSCGAGEACMFTGSAPPFATFACMPIPPFVPGGYGETCTESELERCDTGLACVGADHVPGCEGDRCCTRLGAVAQMPMCPHVAQTCLPFDEAMPDGLCFCGTTP